MSPHYIYKYAHISNIFLFFLEETQSLLFGELKTKTHERLIIIKIDLNRCEV